MNAIWIKNLNFLYLVTLLGSLLMCEVRHVFSVYCTNVSWHASSWLSFGRCVTFHHVTCLLRELHWLPVIFQAQLTMLMITYKALYGLSPEYLKDRLTLHTYTCMTSSVIWRGPFPCPPTSRDMAGGN